MGLTIIIKKGLRADRLKPTAQHREIIQAVNQAVESGVKPMEAWDRVRHSTGSDHKAAHVNCNI
jgi:hypothetical protein